MKIRRVGLDIDGTLADYMGTAVPLLKEMYDLEPDYSVQAYHLEEVFGLTKETRPPNMRERLYEDQHLFLKLLPLEGMNKVTHALHEKGVKIYVMTARTPTPTIVEDTWLWLERHNFIVDDVFFEGDKASLCSMVDVSVIMEDELGQILRLRRAGVDVVISDQPWNRTLPDDPHYGFLPRVGGTEGRTVRVAGWREALRSIEEFLG